MRTDHGQLVKLKDYAPPAYRAKTVVLDFRLEPENTIISSSVTYERARETPAGTPLKLDGDGLQAVSVSIDGKPVAPKDFSATPDRLVLRKPPATRKFTLEIVTAINPTANSRLMGLYRTGGNYCTQCEAEGFRRITYFQDRPDVMAVYTVRMEADSKDNPVLLGNGNLIETGKLDGGRHFAVWHDPHPKPSYLFALVAGDLEVVHDDFTTMSGRKVKLGIFVEKGKGDKAAWAMDSLIRSMQWDERVFGREYDLDVFNIVAVSDFNMGAMENKGLNVFNDKYVLADADTATDADYGNIEAIIAHEYFHNWTGNRITCRDWFQLCLKEGLTVYRDQEFSADERSRPVERIGDVRQLRAAQFPEDAGPLAHPVRPEAYREINNFYTATVYEKGAEVVRMIATILGPKAFRKGMDLYFKRHDGEAATIERFIKCFEDAGKTDLSQFALWYSQAGTPHVPVSATHDKVKATLTLEIEQTLAPTPGQARKKPMHIPLRIALFNSRGERMVAKAASGADNDGELFHLRKANHRIVFTGITERPAVSVNRGFTAPVVIDFSQSKLDLALLAACDDDPFNRWQAWQEFAMRQLIAGARALARGKAPQYDPKLVEAAVAIAGDASLEPAYSAMAIGLPVEGEIAQAIGRNVDPDAIRRARSALGEMLGKSLEAVRIALKDELATPAPYSPQARDAGKRSLNNLLLSFGVMSGSSAAEADSIAQFETADNMNDRFAALSRIVQLHASRGAAAKALEAFEARHGDNPLVMDKWFSVQAMAHGPKPAARMKTLMKHPAFSIRNPNRVRSLIGMFATANATGFNAASGEGYELVCAKIAEIDTINPQVAARLMTAFRSWRMLEPGRRKLAQAAMKSLQSGNALSRDTKDILDRILADT
ncbi:MAG: aminopeptidase N [Nitratireductor sp.]